MFALSSITTLWQDCTFADAVMTAVIWGFLFLPAAGVFLLLAYLVNLPLTRRERARFFLDLVERGIQSGRSVEQVIKELSQLKDASLGVGFHRVAAHLEEGMPLVEALDASRGFLPPQMIHMLKAGAAIGDMRKVLPACRILLRDGLSQFIKGQNYLYATLFASSPASIVVLFGIMTYILPKFREIWRDMEVTLPWFFLLLCQALPGIIVFQALVVVALAGFALLYMGGPRCAAWLEAGFPLYGGWIRYRIPWQRWRMQRDFASIASLLLDGGISEFESIKLAASCPGNVCFQWKANEVLKRLESGEKLADAVLPLDESSELSWRLANAGRDRDGFAASLQAWCESLDARAFQQEQAFAQLFSSGLAAFNGLVVLATAVVVFMPMYTLLNEALLW